MFGLHTITSRVATVISRSIAGRSWRCSASSGTVIARAPEAADEVRVDRERRPRVHELGAGLEQRLAGGEQDVARAVADRDPRGRHFVALGQALAQDRVGRVGVAVERCRARGRSPRAPPAGADRATRCSPGAPAAPARRSRRRPDRRGCGGCALRTRSPWSAHCDGPTPTARSRHARPRAARVAIARPAGRRAARRPRRGRRAWARGRPRAW